MTHNDHVGKGINAVILCHLGGGDIEDFHIGTGDLLSNERRIHINLTTGNNGIHIFLQRRQIHGDEHVRGGDNGGAHGGLGQDHVAVGSTAPHLRAVGGQPGDLQLLQKAFISQEFTGKQDTLSAKACDEDLSRFHFASASFAAVLSLYVPKG